MSFASITSTEMAGTVETLEWFQFEVSAFVTQQVLSSTKVLVADHAVASIKAFSHVFREFLRISSVFKWINEGESGTGSTGQGDGS